MAAMVDHGGCVVAVGFQPRQATPLGFWLFLLSKLLRVM